MNRILFFILLLLTQLGFAQTTKTWTGATQNWNSATNWSPNGVPTNTDAVIIPGSTPNAPNVGSGSPTCASITFDGNTTSLSVNSGATLTVTGAITAASSNSSSRTVTISGLGAVTAGSLAVGTNVSPNTNNPTTTLISTISTFKVLGNISLFSSINFSNTNNATFDLESGTLNLDGQLSTTNEHSSNTSTFSMATGAQSGTLQLSHASPIQLSGTGTNTFLFNGTTATVNYDGTNQAVAAGTYRNLTLSGSGTKTANGAITVNGSLNTAGAVILNMATFSLAGTLTAIINAGTIRTQNTSATPIPTAKAWGGTVHYDGVNQTVAEGSYSNLTLSGGGTKSVTNNIHVTDNITVSGTATLAPNAVNRISDVAKLILNGGSYASGGFSETIATLTLTENSTLALGTGNHTLNFAASNAVGWTAGKTLTITGWTGVFGSSGRIFVGNSANALTTAQLAQINFQGAGTGATLLSTGELVPAYCPFSGNTQSGTTQSICYNSDVSGANIGRVSFSGVTVGRYIAVNVIQGIQYRIATTTADKTFIKRLSLLNKNNTSTVLATTNATAANAAASIDWTATFTGVLYVVFNTSNCQTSTQTDDVTVTYIGGSNTIDNQTAAGTDYWIGHVYNFSDSASVPPTDADAFSSYLGNFTVTNSTLSTNGTITTYFNENYNTASGTAVCFPFTAGGTPQTVYTETFAVRYKMRSSLAAGCYLLGITGDDGVRVKVDGVLVFNAWTQQSPTDYQNILVYLNGNSLIEFDYYEKNGDNESDFRIQAVSPNFNSILTTSPITRCVNTTTFLDGSALPPYQGTNPNPTLQTQWQSSPDNVNWTNIPGATSEDYTVPATAPSVVTVLYYRRMVKGMWVNTADNCVYYTNVIQITTSPAPTITTQPATTTQSYCLNATATPLSVTATGLGLTYQWYSNTTASTSDAMLISGATSSSYTPLTTTAGTRYYYCIVSSSTCGTPVTSNFSGAITVNANLTASVSIAKNPTGSICSGSSVTFTATPTNGGTTPAYQWKLNGTNVGTNLATYTTTSLVNNDKITVVMTSNATTCVTGNPATSNELTVTVNPKAAINNMTSTACSGTSFTATPVNSTNGVVPSGTTYSWSAPSVSGITGTASGSNAANISGTLANTTNAAINVVYTVTPTSGSCTGATFTVTVTVNPKPAINNMTSTACSGTTFTATPVNSTNGVVPAGTTYTWTAPAVTGSMTGGVANATGTASITGTLTNPTTTTQTATYTVTPTSGSCTGATFTVTVTVNPKATINNMTSTVCSGTSFTATPVNSTNGVVPAGTTYTWTAPAVTGSMTGGVANATGTASITGTLTNPTTTTQTATYTVTPTSGSCTGATFTVIVTVNPKPAINNMTSTACSGTTFSVTPANTTNGVVPSGTTYSWSAPSVSGITGTASGSNAANISGTLANTTNAAINVVYTVTPTSGSCSGATFTVTVTVNPTTVGGTISGSATACFPYSNNQLTLSGHTGNIIRWESSVSPFSTWTNITNTGTTHTIGNISTDTKYRAVLQSGSCTSAYSAEKTVTVIGAIGTGGPIYINDVIPLTGNFAFCKGTSVKISVMPVANAATYTWELPTDWIITSGAGTHTIQATVGTNTGNINVMARNGCGGEARSSYIWATSEVLPNVPATVNPDTANCTGFTARWGYVGNATIYYLDVSANNTFTALVPTYIDFPVIGTNTTSYALTGLNPGTTYYYRVRASNPCGVSANSGTMNIATQAIPSTPAVSTITQPNCLTPTGSVVLSGLPASGTINQTGTAATSYTITGTSMTLAGLAVGTYNFTVTQSGCTSLTSGNVVINPVVVTPAPQISSITQPNCATATGSVVLNGLPNGNWELTESPGNRIITGSGSSTTISGLIGGTTYTYKVKGLVNGLKADYYNNMTLTGSPALSRTDATVNFNWGTGSPDPLVNENGFSARWTGFVQPRFSEEYTFITRADDGVRLWVNGVQLVDNWTDQAPTDRTGTITLTAGVKYSIVVEYYENAGGAVCELAWRSLRQSQEIIPNSQLFYLDNCSSAASANVVINPQPATPSAPQIGLMTHISCITATGSVVLNNLPTGNWTINQAGTATQSYTGSGTSYTITGLAAGTYTFSVTNAGDCTSASTAEITITSNDYTTWNGTIWSHGTPDATKNVIINGALTISADMAACGVTINSGFLVTVKSGVTLTVTNAVTTNGQLIFENTASLLQTTNVENRGNIEYHRTSSQMKDFDFTYWASPVAHQNIVELSPNTLGDKFYKWNGTVGWEIYRDEMIPGAGYIIRTPRASTWPNGEVVVFPYSQKVTFKGVPNNGNYSFDVGPDEYNLVGNPYPSALDADQFITQNAGLIYGALYFWTHNTAIKQQEQGSHYDYTADDYATYTLTGGVGTGVGKAATNPGLNNSIPLGKIAAGQSFFVGNQPKSGTFVFNNSMRVAGNNTQFFGLKNTQKTTIEKNRIWLNLTNSGGAFKQLLVGYLSGATNGWDNLYDGPTFDGQEFVDFYSVNQGQNLTIQGRALPFEKTDEVPLGYRSTIEGQFEIAIDSRDGKLATHEIWLEDKKTGVTHDLVKSSYAFSAIEGVENDRFVLKYFHKSLGTDDNEMANKAVLVAVKNKTISVISTADALRKIEIFDVLGRLLYTKSNLNSQEWIIPNFTASEQTLVVKTTLENGAISSTKIVF